MSVKFRIPWKDDHMADLLDLLKDAAQKGFGDEFAIPQLLRMAREREKMRKEQPSVDQD